METKTEQVIRALKQGDHKTALKIASTFKLGFLKTEQNTIVRGYECLNNARYYVQLGYNPVEQTEKAIALLSARYLN